MTTPTSTYRLQIRASLTLDDAAGLLDYLTALGVGAVYLSPLLTSTQGSDHGYDVTDPTTIDPQRGGEQGWQRLLAAAARAGLEVVVDIVPNHVGVEVAEQNPAWWDVLTHGRSSAYADWFDIDWSSDKLLLPVLGDGDQELDQLTITDGKLCYWEHRFPIAPGTEDGSPIEVHDRQHYRLVSFRKGQTDLGYRRFFAVTTLAGVRVEDESVFLATHQRLAKMITEGVSGIRVDHPDGLADPTGYLQRLRALAPEAWITAEKILQRGEPLPDWPIAGTTGYDALAGFSGVFVDTSAERALTDCYRRLTGDDLAAGDHERAGKTLVLQTLFGSELRRIAALAQDVPDARRLIMEAAIRFGVYRSYLPEGADLIIAALDQVRQEQPELAPTADALQPRLTDAGDELAVRFQQLTGAVMAKGVEDTAFYRFNRLVSLNEVGGDPGQFGVSVEEFHRLQAERLQQWPEAMTTLSTHDTKRSEDVRAAIAVLTEIPDRWEEFARTLSGAVPMPEPTIGYLLLQTVAAVGLIDRQRMHSYAEKSIREAAIGTGWIDGDEAFETAVHAGIDQFYDSPELSARIEDFRAGIHPAVVTNVLGQKLVQLTAPGVPDVYQGTEYGDDSLVDPDNRRPVDFAARSRLLAELDRNGPPPEDSDLDTLKLWVTSRALRAKRRFAGSMSTYQPMAADGPAADHLLGFSRGPLLTLATRLPIGLRSAGGWGRTELTLPDGEWTDLLSLQKHSGTVRLDAVLARYPVALLAAPTD
jgi:(1->4)-alpha-D-glucan 1-alpha-D-glucosylmutase